MTTDTRHLEAMANALMVGKKIDKATALAEAKQMLEGPIKVVDYTGKKPKTTIYPGKKK